VRPWVVVGAQRYRAIVAYDGTDYGGFQIQASGLTIQGELERALRSATQEFVRIVGAGRTDAGVHAQGQVISFETSWRHGVETLQRAMNALLPDDIVVRDLAPAEERFHARFSARQRTYRYWVHHAPASQPLMRRYGWGLAKRPDVEAMQRAAGHLLGEHDFAAFGQAPGGGNTVRAVLRAEWRGREAPPWAGADVELWEFEIAANAFLRGMVRRVVGTLLLVGSGELSADGFAEVLASRDPARSGPPAPARGLTLWRVEYGDGASTPGAGRNNDAAHKAVTGGLQRPGNRRRRGPEPASLEHGRSRLGEDV